MLPPRNEAPISQETRQQPQEMATPLLTPPSDTEVPSPPRPSPTLASSPIHKNSSSLTTDSSLNKEDSSSSPQWSSADSHVSDEQTTREKPASAEEDHLKSLESMTVPSTSKANSSHTSDSSTPDTAKPEKPKRIQCKQCLHISKSKYESYEHRKTHIAKGKLLLCTICNFGTEYKHHLEYHLRNHQGAKPFKCHLCEYTCVNKSMLKSHMKSHSQIYQYRRKDCKYMANYMHSLKQHLRKTNHSPDVVLNPDGTPNPFPVVDVYGTRRGPKVKSQRSRREASAPPLPVHAPLVQNPPNLVPNVPPMNRASFKVLQQLAFQYQFQRNILAGLQGMLMNPVLDLSSRRDSCESGQRVGGSDDEEYEFEPSMFVQTTIGDSTPTHAIDSPAKSMDWRSGPVGSPPRIQSMRRLSNRSQSPKPINDFRCIFCDIIFRKQLMYDIHMRYHKPNEPFTCNVCDSSYDTDIEFFYHIGHCCVRANV